MFVEFHMLQNHSPSNLNRDDMGAPKSAVFGGIPRARISSQCLKRSIRLSDTFKSALEGKTGQRTVALPELVQRILAEGKTSIPEDQRALVVAACARIAQAEDKQDAKASGKKKVKEEDDRPRTAQLIFLGPQEANEFVLRLERLREEMPEDYKAFLAVFGEGEKGKGPRKKFWESLREAYAQDGVDIALFGRMTTSPAFEDVEASMEVAHALSTTEFTPEVDYFTAVDDIPGRQGAAYLEDAQFGSATFYKYFSLDWDSLLANLNSDAALAADVLRAFARAAATTVPSGKRNSFGNANLPDGILVEVKRQAIPTNYANAFLVPARAYSDHSGEHDVVADSVRKLAHYVGTVTKTYGIESERFWLTTRPEVPFEGAERAETLEGLVKSVVEVVQAEEARHEQG